MKCPKCGSSMRLIPSKRDNGLFWGCSKYPVCNGTARYIDPGYDEPKKPFIPSPMQQAIFDEIKHGHKNIVITAAAGSGKTTTLIEAMKLLPDSDILFLAFNKAIADELEKRAPVNATVGTLHRIGFQYIRQKYPSAKLDTDKVYHIVENLAGRYGISSKYWSIIIKTVGLMKSLLIDEPTLEQLTDLADFYSIEYPPEILERLPEILRDCWQASMHMALSGEIDFDDMVLLPVLYPELCKKWEYIFADECQDFSTSNIKFLQNSIGEGSRVICVGDPHQSIYGFRGANVDSMDILQASLQAITLPLSVCYRCPTSHISLAQQIVPEIMPKEGAEEGVIEYRSTYGIEDVLQKGDLVISRKNATLIPPVLQLLSRGVKVSIKGQDIGQSMIRLLEKHGEQKSLTDALEAIRKHTAKEVARLNTAGKEDKANQLNDLFNALVLLATKAVTVADLLSTIKLIFSDTSSDIIFSSIHKAKGLEADTVYILNAHEMPLAVSKPWAQQQEQNILYVALTRAKHKLVLTRGV